MLDRITARARVAPLALLALVALAAGCTGDVTAVAAHDDHGAAASARRSAPLTADAHRQIAELRRATAHFHQIARANAAAYDDVLTGCMAAPDGAGAMGVHVGDLSRFDAVLDHTRPEILMYEPQPGGRMKLLGVEFAVPFDAWTSEEPPRLFDQAFHRNEAFGLWVLHVWVWRENPSGIFADWNPKVHC